MKENVMYSLIAVFAGGGVGSVLRWLCCSFIPSHWGTMFVNVAGAFFIGCAYSYFARSSLRNEAKVFAMTGLLGGFTTFSTYLLNFITLLNENKITEGFVYLLLSVLAGSLFLLAGIRLAS